GTPSLLPPSAVERLIDAALRLFSVDNGVEITLEANPTDAEMARFSAFRAAGINRLSLGIQSYDDSQLSFLGRNHTGMEARRAADVAADIFQIYTLDFIYALPKETALEWEARLKDILSQEPLHLSLYQLTVEPMTPFAKAVERGVWTPLPDERSADLYEITQCLTTEAGCAAYEVSNHAVPGAAAVHNSLYWKGADWIAIGPGAHGRLSVVGERLAVEGQADIRSWLKMPYAERYHTETLEDEDILIELLAGALRTREGLALSQLNDSARQKVEKAVGGIADSGMIELRGGQLVIPQTHRLITDYVIGQLVRQL
ncbi:MAG: coproporphyrinogen-III oxidase family protein, partial [Pseudomonadota bacterium]